MDLPIAHPFPPMEATPAEELPSGPQWQYEPKWDGFRCLAFRDDDHVELQSKAQKPLTRYFPEVVEALMKVKARRFVLDGELVVPRGAGLSFDDLLQRIHPAASRVRRLARDTPAHFITFDLLVAEQGLTLVEQPLRKRRQKLEQFVRKHFGEAPALHLSPATQDMRTARRWVEKSGNALDGLIAKRMDMPYRAGERNAAKKVKFYKSADCVVGGFRYSRKGEQAASLLLGLYDDEGLLHHVGHCTVSARLKPGELTQQLEGLVGPPGFTGNAPGGPSRWATERSVEWQPLRPELVIEVQYDHLTAERFRHGTKFLRWRPDKAPEQCTMDQIRSEARSPLHLLTR
jgi:ATP-dependent DNA ligase